MSTVTNTVQSLEKIFAHSTNTEYDIHIYIYTYIYYIN